MYFLTDSSVTMPTDDTKQLRVHTDGSLVFNDGNSRLN